MHKTVLLQEVIEGLSLGKDSVVIDGTFGGGGHSMGICKRYRGVKIIALDQDKSTLQKKDINCDITFHNENFRNLDKVLKKEGIEKVNGIILDLGLSSDQLENSGRGFSFTKDEPLLMTMKENPSLEDLTAQEVVNTWEEHNLADIIYGYGEERFAKRIAKAIVEARAKSEIKTTFDLVKIIEESVPSFYKRGRLHFATKTFQAIRITVNDELGALSVGLAKGFDCLESGGRMAVISFHSLEDRIVKRFYKAKEKEKIAKLLNKKPITSNREEVKNNPRARSAKLRIMQKI
ncbi:MAG: 16S rRNA (cytosine(1402)-N(4))-methyltransferase RsmH [Candidatus Paceibacterota bacterium]